MKNKSPDPFHCEYCGASITDKELMCKECWDEREYLLENNPTFKRLNKIFIEVNLCKKITGVIMIFFGILTLLGVSEAIPIDSVLVGVEFIATCLSCALYFVARHIYNGIYHDICWQLDIELYKLAFERRAKRKDE